MNKLQADMNNLQVQTAALQQDVDATYKSCWWLCQKVRHLPVPFINKKIRRGGASFPEILVSRKALVLIIEHSLVHSHILL